MLRVKPLSLLSAVLLLAVNAPLWAADAETFSIDGKKIPAACTFTDWVVTDQSFRYHQSILADATSTLSLEDYSGRRHATLRMPGCDMKELQEAPQSPDYTPSGVVLSPCNPNSCIPTHIAWDLNGKTGQYEVSSLLPGMYKQIDHVAVSADGKYIALGIGYHTRLMQRKGYLQLLRTEDHKTVLEVPMATENGASVAFIENNLVFSRFNEERKHHETLVIPLP